jgi:type I pantothenate kinase
MTDPSEPDDRDLLAPLAGLIADRVETSDGRRLLVGLAGGVSVGKSTIAAALAERLGTHHGLTTAVVASDGFLFSTVELAERGLTHRKGFPESYDHDALHHFITAVRAGDDPLEVPRYDHLFYDVLPEPELVPGATVVILEGVNVLHFADHLDVGVYVDAAEPDMRRWFVRRVLGLRDEASEVPGAYLHPYRDVADDDVAAMAVGVWEAINWPNLREHIEPTRDRADVVVVKGPDHDVAELRLRLR